MTRPLILAAAAATLLSASFVTAQESTEAETPSEPQLSDQLDTGEVVNEAPQNAAPVDRTYVLETNGDWDLQCLRVNDDGTNSDADPCQMYQLLKDQQGASVAEVSIFKLEGQGQIIAGATIVAPLETLLTEKITVSVDGGQAKRYDFSFCTPIGCYARVGFTQGDVNAFKAGAVANVSIVPALARDQRVTLAMSLTGFTASYDKVTPVTQGR